MAIEQKTEDSSRVGDYWKEQFAKNRADASLWTNNPIIAQHIYRLISDGSPQHWLPWFLNDYLSPGVVFEKSLSVCCGDGMHEMVLANSGRVRFVRGFDISEGAIAQARQTFQNAGIPPESYRLEVADANNLELEDTFDLILSTGALHHVTNLEGLLTTLSKRLDAHGYFVVLEYVGPNRFQWTDAQIGVINGILRQLDTRHLKDNARKELSRPSVETMIATDPSEAVRSEDVMRVLEEHFMIEYRRNFNGTVMHQLYPLLNDQLTTAGDREFDNIVRLILWMEDVLIREKVLSSDFVFAICRPKNVSTSAGAVASHPREYRYVGFIDYYDGRNIAGWAANVTGTDAPVTVEIYVDDQLQATGTADGFRQDLKEAGYGDGRRGFNLALPENAVPRPLSELRVAGSEQVLSTRRAVAFGGTVQP